MRDGIIQILLGHALLGAVLTIFALGMAFWLLLAFRIARTVIQKRTMLEGALLASAKTYPEAAQARQFRAP
jgi:hypothetical protein